MLGSAGGIKSKVLRSIYVLIAGCVCGFYIYISECRSILLCLLAFVSLYLFKKRTFSQSFLRKIICLSQAGSLIFVLLYLYLYRHSFDIELSLFGKSFYSGRQIVWGSAFDLFLQHPIIGSGASVRLKSVANTVTASAHNTVMSLLYIFGAVPTASYFLFMGKRYDNSMPYTPYRLNQFAVIATLLITFFESFYTESYLGFLFMLFFIPEFIPIESTIDAKRSGILNDT